MTSKSKKSPKTPAKKIVPKKAVIKNKTTVKKRATARKAVVKIPVDKKKPAVKKSTLVKKSIPTKKATSKKSIKKTDVVAKVAKEKVVNPKIGILVEAVANNNPLTKEKSIVENTVITDLPVPDNNTRQRKFTRNYDKHQIQLSSVKKGGQNHPVKSHSGKNIYSFTSKREVYS